MPLFVQLNDKGGQIMPLVNYFKRAVKDNYMNFNGRDSKRQYWMFFAANFILSLLVGWIPVVSWIYCIAIMIPGIAAGVRRLHDTGKSGWYLILDLIPIVGFIIVIVFLCQDGQPEANMYGEVPVDEYLQ